MDIQGINDQAKFYFDNKQFDKALETLNLPNLPDELIPNLAKCYYYNSNATKALDLVLPLVKTQEHRSLKHSSRGQKISGTQLGQFPISTCLHFGQNL